MHHTTDSILRHFDAVRAERERRRRAPELDERVQAVKHYQQQRFLNTYRDLLGDPRYARATHFFLEEIYGPKDFSDRDAQFSGLVPALVTLFPQRVVDAIGLLGELHSLTESLDSRMAEALPSCKLGAVEYVRAWQASSSPEEREQQRGMVIAVGESMDAHTRIPLLRQTIQLVRKPAEAAGLGELHRLLVRGYDSFESLGGAQPFLRTVAARERALSARLFAADALEGVREENRDGSDGGSSADARDTLLRSLP